MDHFKRVYMNARQGGKNYWMQNQIRFNERGTEMQDLTIRKDKVLKAAEVCPEAKKVLIELFPEAFAEAYVSGDIFFHMHRYCQEHCMISQKEQEDLRRALVPHKIDVFSYDYAKFTYILAHLKNAKEYGLFNLSTGYQLCRNDIYIRKQGVGIMIPRETLHGLIKIRSGGGK